MSQCLNPECLTINPDNFQFCQKCGNKLLLVERYWAKSILGQGGFGRTFLAVDEFKPSKPFCVIKQFLPQAQGTETVAKAAELFAQEAERLELLGKHSQIPELFAYFSVDSRQYLVQEFIKGETLQQELDNRGVFNESQIRELLIDLLSVLQFFHSHNVIHRDIKPENIIRREGDKKLVLVDFGAAKVLPKTQSPMVTGTVIGSAEYCAPEQSMGKAKSGSDLYSLGVTCLHLLTQMNPFDLYDVMEMEWVWRDCLNGNFVSDELGKVLDSLVEQKPKQRYQKVEDVLADLGFGNSAVSVTKKIQQPRQNFVSNDVPLVSVRGVNYTKLRDLLAAGKWKEADQETERCMLKVARRENEGYLGAKDIDNFPCEDLRTIDQLWVKYSNGKFGFSVQKQIYQSLGGTRNYDREIWEAFCDKVGWRQGGKFVVYSELTFSRDTHYTGHLPAVGKGGWVGVRGCGWVLGKARGGALSSLFSRAETCRL
ncbi:GUN4 domain-containing protein [Dapis sp. BLCC M172]|uniref:GUN4 domain-containing protein n=1 Tax=Dapis sp. BLCC M172 TaxID=2975281 RepID=UPI003CE6D7C6